MEKPRPSEELKLIFKVESSGLKKALSFKVQLTFLIHNYFRGFFGYEKYRKSGHFVDHCMRPIILKYSNWVSYTEDHLAFQAHHNRVCCIVVSSDGQYLFTGSSDKTVICWYLEKSVSMIHQWKAHSDWVRCLDYHSGLLVSGGDDYIVRVWGVLTFTLINELKGHKDFIVSVKFINEGSHIVSASRDQTLRLYSSIHGDCLRVLTGHTDRVRCMVVDKETTLISGSDDSTIQLWKYQYCMNDECRKQLKSIECANVQKLGSKVTCLSINCNRTMIACLTHGGQLIIVDFSDCSIISRSSGINASNLIFHPHYPSVIILGGRGSEEPTIILDLSDERYRRCLKGSCDFGLIFTPDGSRLIGCDNNGFVRMWNIESMLDLKTFQS